jgi:hypothetical protein
MRQWKPRDALTAMTPKASCRVLLFLLPHILGGVLLIEMCIEGQNEQIHIDRALWDLMHQVRGWLEERDGCQGNSSLYLV